MYDDLINRLNEYSARRQGHGGIAAEAADALQELNAKYQKALHDLAALEECSDVAKEAKTNFDKLIQGTPEQLAMELALPCVASPPWCSEHLFCPYFNGEMPRCDLCALDWLLREVDS